MEAIEIVGVVVCSVLLVFIIYMIVSMVTSEIESRIDKGVKEIVGKESALITDRIGKVEERLEYKIDRTVADIYNIRKVISAVNEHIGVDFKQDDVVVFDTPLEGEEE